MEETKYKLVEKAYGINFSKVDEGYSYSEEICYAENLNKAKAILLEKANNYLNFNLLYKDEDVSYINIPVIRFKEYDRYEYNDEKLTLDEIEKVIAEEKRNSKLDEILNDDSISYCFIMKRGGYYRPNSSGYTGNPEHAGLYTK